MSRTIDERIVQMTFNNSNFEKNAKTTISTLDKLKQSLDFSNAKDSVGVLQKAANSIDLSGMTRSMQVFETIATGALLNVGRRIEELGEKVLKFVTQFNAFSPENLVSGWGKYDQIIAAEQKIMSSVGGKTNPLTGEVYDLDAVLERIDKLRWYSDETSYSIDQMTNAIGDFTASGVDLDVATTAIMGISNACGDAGISAESAQYAFTGFARALGSGYMSLSVWNHQLKTSGLTNSERFKQSLIDAAEACGELVRKGDELYVKNTNVRVGIDNMTESMTKYQWATKEVMMTALASYSDTVDALHALTHGTEVDWSAKVFDDFNKAMKEQGKTFESLNLQEEYSTASEAIRALKKAYTDLGLEVPKSLAAFGRAQEAISFKQVTEATHVAISSQLANLFETIVGNYEEAKQLWTQMSEDFYNWFVDGLNDVNDIFAEWKGMWDSDSSSIQFFNFGEKEGQENVTQILATYRAFAAIIDRLKESFDRMWEEVFDPVTARSIFNFVEGIRQSFINFYNYMNEDGTPFEGVLSVVKTLLYTIKLLVNTGKEFVNSFVKPLIDLFKPIAEEILEIFDDLGFIIRKTIQPMVKDMSPFQRLLSNILNILKPIINIISSIVHWIHELTSSIATGGEITVFGQAFGFIGKVFETLAGIMQGTIPLFKTVGDAISNIVGKIKGVLGNFLSSSGTDIKNLAEGGILGYILLSLTGFIKKIKTLDFSEIKNLSTFIPKVIEAFTGGDDSDESLGFFGTLKKGIGDFFGMFKDIGKSFSGLFSQAAKSLEEFSKAKIKTETIQAISRSLLMLAGALLIVSLIDSDKIAQSLNALFVVLSEASAVMLLMDNLKGNKGMGKAAAAFISLGASLILLATALKIMSSIDEKALQNGMVVMGVSLLGLFAFLSMTGNMLSKVKPSVIKSIGTSMIGIGIGLIAIGASLKIMSSIDSKGMETALGGLLTSLGAVFVLITGIGVLVKGGIGAGFKIASIGAAMIGIGAGLILLSGALKIMSTINADQMKVAVGALFEVLAIITGMGAILSLTGAGSFAAVAAGMLIMSVALIGIASAITILGKSDPGKVQQGLDALVGALISIGGVGAILGLLSPLLAAFALSFIAFGGALIIASKGILSFTAAAGALNLLGEDISFNLLKIFEEIFASIIQLVPSFILGVARGILNVASELLNVIGDLLLMVLDKIKEYVPSIVVTGAYIIISLLQGIRDNIGEVITVALEVVGNFITALGEGLPTVIDAGMQFIIDFLNGLADSVRSNAGAIGSAIANLASAIIEGIVSGLLSGVKTFASNLLEAGGNLIESIASWLSGGEDPEATKDSGKNIVRNVQVGIEEESPQLNNAISEVASEASENFYDEEGTTKSANQTVGTLVSTFTSKASLSKVRSAGGRLASEIIEGYKQRLDQHSPSREMMRQAAFTVQGILDGFRQSMDEVYSAGSETGTTLVKSITNAIDMADSIVNDGLNPVITPVLDLSNVEQSSSQIAGLLDNGASYNAALAISNARALEFQNGGTAGSSGLVVNVDFNIDNVGGELTEAQITRFGRQIANVVNNELGGML